jgi:hypothetical protein
VVILLHVTAATEAWDGTSWTEVADLATARQAIACAGGPNSSDALAAGGGTIMQQKNGQHLI